MIIIKLMGGLGNQMFQYSLGKSLSINKKIKFKLDLKFLLDRTPKKNFVYRDYDLSIFQIEVNLSAEAFAKLSELAESEANLIQYLNDFLKYYAYADNYITIQCNQLEHMIKNGLQNDIISNKNKIISIKF